MIKILRIAGIAMAIFASCLQIQAQPTKILIMLPQNYGANYFLNRDNFENLGWDITITGTSDYIDPCPVYASPLGAPRIKSDLTIDEISDVEDYDCIAIMSGSHWAGNPCVDLIDNTDAQRLISDAVSKRMVVAAWCTGVRVLAAANVINNKNVIGNPNYSAEYTAAGANFLGKNRPPEIDGNIITCAAGDFYNKQNCFALLKVLSAKKSSQAHIRQRKIASLWNNKFGGSNSDGGKSAITLDNGDVVVAGYTFSSSNGKSDMLLSNMDSLGNIKWSRNYGGSGWDYAYSVQQTEDDGFIMAGLTTSSGSGSADMYVIKTNSTGNQEWAKTFGGASWDVANSVCITSDGNYVICGSTESFGSGQDDIILIKLGKSGNQLWQKTFGTSNSEMGYKAIETSDGNLMIVGNTGRFVHNTGDRDIYVIKTSATGNQVWAKQLGSYGNAHYHERGVDICEISDGGYLIAGSHDITYDDVSNMMLLKISESGSELWRKSLGRGSFYDYGTSVCEVSPNRYVLAGASKSTSSNNGVYLYWFDGNGNQLERKKYTNSNNDWVNSLSIDKNHNITLVGHSLASTHNFDVLVQKIEGGLPTGLVDNEKINITNFHLSPNPCGHYLTISIEIEETGILNIYDISGRKLKTFKRVNPENSLFNWNLTSDTGQKLANGLYICSFISQNHRITQKFIIEN